MAWILTDDTSNATARPNTTPGKTAHHSASPRSAELAPARKAAQKDDLKTECANHPEAQTDQGWPHSLCPRSPQPPWDRRILRRHRPGGGTVLAGQAE